MEKSRIQLALDAHKVKGLDCCESIFTTYCDLLGVPYGLALAISDCYGSNTGINGVFDSYENLFFFRYMYVCAGYGIDMMFGNCGALCGAQLCAAVRHNPIEGEVPRDMMAPFALCDTIRELFNAEAKAETCGSLTNAKLASVKTYGCDKAIRLAAKLVEDLVFPGVFEPCEFDDLPDWDIDANAFWPAEDKSVYMSTAPKKYQVSAGGDAAYTIVPFVERKYENSTVEMTMGSERLKAMRPPISEILGKMEEFAASGNYTDGEYYYRGVYLEALRDEDEERLIASFWGLAVCCKKADLDVRLMDMASHGIQKMDDWGYSRASVFGSALLNYAFSRYTLGDIKEAASYLEAAERVMFGGEKALAPQRITLNYYKALILAEQGKKTDADAALEAAKELLNDIPGYEKQKEFLKNAF